MENFSWTNKVDDVDVCKAEDVNSLAEGINNIITDINSNYYTKTIIDTKTSGICKYKGRTDFLPSSTAAVVGDVWVKTTGEYGKFCGVNIVSVYAYGMGFDGEGGDMILSSASGFAVGKTYYVSTKNKKVLGTITPTGISGNTLSFTHQTNSDYYGVVCDIAETKDSDYWNTWMGGNPVGIGETYYFYNADFDTAPPSNDTINVTICEPNTPFVKTQTGWDALGGTVDFSDYYTRTQTDTKATAAEENAKTYGNQTFAGALKGEKLGGIVRLDDVSALDRRLDTVVSSKNIIPFPYERGTMTNNGVTFTVSDDGSITVNGTATANAWFFLFYETPLHVIAGTTYAIKSVGDDAKYNETYWFAFDLYDSDGVLSDSKVVQNVDTTFYVQDNQRTIRYLSITVKSGYTANNIVIKPQIEEGTVPTAYTKHVSDLSGISLKKIGKNLFHCYGISANSIRKPGASCTLSNAYGTTIDKTALSSASDVLTVTQTEHPSSNYANYANGYFCIGLSDMIVGQNYTLSFTFNKTDDPLSAMTGLNLQAFLNGSKAVPWQRVSSKRFSISFTWEVSGAQPDARYIELRLSGMSGTFSAFQLEPLSTASTYVPWSAPTTYTVGADGTVQNLSAYEDVTTLATDNEGTVLKTKYSRDLNAAFTEIQNAIIALGGSF